MISLPRQQPVQCQSSAVLQLDEHYRFDLFSGQWTSERKRSKAQ